MGLIFALVFPLALLAAVLHSGIGTVLAMPDVANNGYNFSFLFFILPFVLLLSARPVGAGHWWLMVATAAATLIVFDAAWWGAAVVMFRLAPDMQTGLFSGLLPMVTGCGFGILAYLATQRLAGVHSPWRNDDAASEEGPPA